MAEKAINSPGVPISPGEALRIVFEILASGLILRFGPGILDPCEKESCDALVGMSDQAREDVTAFAQVYKIIYMLSTIDVYNHRFIVFFICSKL